jgi:formylglycine-generating enzyme required for sulfatase activity
VGQFPFGDAPGAIHDLAGNVGEWTADRLPSGEAILKGSASNASEPSDVRVTGRDVLRPVFRAHVAGFRCVQ